MDFYPQPRQMCYEVSSLYDLAINELCNSMTEELLEYVLQWTGSSLCFEIVWKVLAICNKTQKFLDYDNDERSTSVIRGNLLAKMSHNLSGARLPISYVRVSVDAHIRFANSQQTKFVDDFNFCGRFNLNLFFKFVKLTSSRNQLFTIFQVVIQKRGFQFPKQLAEEWIKNKENSGYSDHSDIFLVIEEGLKLGIFLGDAGWLIESALVLSHVYKVIITKWACPDENLIRTKVIQCLTKWLLVASNGYNFDEAKEVLKKMYNTLSDFEKIENNPLCIAYAYVAVSQYYYVLMDYKESWSWAVKAVRELRDTSCSALKLLVIGHTVRVSSVLNKLSTGKKLLDQLNTYDQPIDQNIRVDMLLNEACYSLKADLARDSINSYYAALDSRRNLFGYYNLHTATVFVDYAYARYVCDYSTTDFNEAMTSILQAIFIMNEIGLPKDNMFLISAGRIKALILEEKALDLVDRGFLYYPDNQYDGDDQVMRSIQKMKKNMLDKAKSLQENALRVSLKAVGEDALVTAKSYCNLGRLYQSLEKYKQSEKMHLKAIEIKEKILGKDDPEVALSLGHLASLYTYQLRRYHEAENLYLRSKAIYEATYGTQYTGLLYDYQGLTRVYRGLGNSDKYNEYVDKIRTFYETREAWLHQVHTESDSYCTQSNLSVEKLKCILDECGCEKL